MFIYVTTINGERDHEFERDQRGVHRRVWREEREEANDVIILSRTKNIIFLKKCSLQQHTHYNCNGTEKIDRKPAGG